MRAGVPDGEGKGEGGIEQRITKWDRMGKEERLRQVQRKAGLGRGEN